METPLNKLNQEDKIENAAKVYPMEIGVHENDFSEICDDKIEEAAKSLAKIEGQTIVNINITPRKFVLNKTEIGAKVLSAEREVPIINMKVTRMKWQGGNLTSSLSKLKFYMKVNC